MKNFLKKYSELQTFAIFSGAVFHNVYSTEDWTGLTGQVLKKKVKDIMNSKNQ